MGRLIDADGLLRIYRKWIPQLTLPEDEGDKRAVEICIAVLEEQPTVDAVPVKRGKWEKMGDDYFDEGMYRCSACKQELYFEEFEFNVKNFCPNCGADMREEQNERD